MLCPGALSSLVIFSLLKRLGCALVWMRKDTLGHEKFREHGPGEILLIFGECLWGIGAIGSLGVGIMTVTTFFPRIDKNLIVAVGQTVGS
jgi:hypothetical protein